MVQVTRLDSVVLDEAVDVDSFDPNDPTESVRGNAALIMNRYSVRAVIPIASAASAVDSQSALPVTGPRLCLLAWIFANFQHVCRLLSTLDGEVVQRHRVSFGVNAEVARHDEPNARARLAV